MQYDIVVCEDNPADVLLLKEAFKAEGLSCALRVAYSGDEARKLLQRLGTGDDSCPDVILIDLHLPEVEGHELIRFLRENGSCGQTPIVVLTSSLSSKEEQDVRALGVNRYIRKPTNLRDFLKIGGQIRELLEKNRAR